MRQYRAAHEVVRGLIEARLRRAELPLAEEQRDALNEQLQLSSAASQGPSRPPLPPAPPAAPGRALPPPPPPPGLRRPLGGVAVHASYSRLHYSRLLCTPPMHASYLFTPQAVVMGGAPLPAQAPADVPGPAGGWGVPSWGAMSSSAAVPPSSYPFAPAAAYSAHSSELPVW